MKTVVPTIVALVALAVVAYKEFAPPCKQAALPSVAVTTAPAPAPAPKPVTSGEVYLAIRSDGKSGSGTCCDPYDASTQQKFDRLFASFGPNTLIHLGPGTYHTRGGVAFQVKSYWKIRGAGYEVTKIIQDLTGQIGCCVFSGRANGVEIEDLSVDCGFQNQQVVNGKIKANASAIGIGGSHIAVRRCYFINYGSPYDAETGENFAVFIGSPDPDNGEDLIVEDCIFAGMTPLLTSGQSVLTIAGGPPKNDLKTGNWARGIIARRNHFTGYHYGCHGITIDGGSGAIASENVFVHFMGACFYQDTWPMRDFIISDNLMIDVNQGIRLTCDNMYDFQIRNNIFLMNDGYDMDRIVKGVVTTHIEHSLVVGNRVRLRGAVFADKSVLKDKDVFVTSTPARTSFTYSLTKGGKSETDDATGGFIQPLDYQGCMCPAPEALVVSPSGGSVAAPPSNFIIEGNIIKPYSSDGTARVPSCGISVYGMRNSRITNNTVFDAGERQNGSAGIDDLTGQKVRPAPGQHADLIVAGPKGYVPSVICRDNYHPDNTRLWPRDSQLQLIPGGLQDNPAPPSAK